MTFAPAFLAEQAIGLALKPIMPTFLSFNEDRIETMPRRM
jgi:hypothetical protein